MLHLFSLFRSALTGVVVTAGMAVAAETDSRFSDAEFEVAEILPMAAGAGGADIKLAYLWVYRSALGSQLQARDLKGDELAELRRICTRMDTRARSVQPQGFDGYGIEFAHGRGDTSRLSPDRRVVFLFWEERGRCNGAPSRGRIE